MSILPWELACEKSRQILLFKWNVLFGDFTPVKAQMEIFSVIIEMDHFFLPSDLKP